MSLHRSYGFLTAALAAALTVATLGSAPADAAPHRASVVKKIQKTAHRVDLEIKSPAMKDTVPVTVLTPGGAGSRGTLYMLDGADAGKTVSDWITKGGAAGFFAGQNVNVVLPAGGAGSFYTNWTRKDAKIGKPQWETFLTQELPPLIAKEFGSNGRSAVLGLSMGGQSAYALTARHPDLYSGAASLSGCPPVSGPANEAYVRTTVANSGGDATNMWGVPGSKQWQAHDPSLHLDALAGKALYLSAGSGAVGPLDFEAKRDPDDGPEEQQIAAGSALEAGAYRCSLEFAATMTAKGVNFVSNFRILGTHSWPYWKQDLPNAWNVLAPAIS